MQPLPRASNDAEPLCQLPRAGGPEGGPGPGQYEGHGDLLQEDPGREEQEVRGGSELGLSQTGWLDDNVRKCSMYVDLF